MSKTNPLSEADKKSKRIEPDVETDNFNTEEALEIADMVVNDARYGSQSISEWVKQRELDLKHYYGEKPSILENLEKKAWQSDRNLGLTAAVCDAYQATLLATCWNPDTIHPVPTEKNDIENRDTIERFTKWLVGRHEGNFFPAVDDFIHNRIVQGFSVFKIYWKVWYEWVDKRIPKKTGGYTIKTEKMRFEKGIIENIDNLDDILTPEYGRSLQEMSFVIHVVHKRAGELLDEGKRKIFKGVDEKFVQSLKQAYLDDLKSKTLDKEKAEKLGITDVTYAELRSFPIDLYEWYGEYTKAGKTEKYRFIVEPYTKTLLSSKPLRKITRTGKLPFVGGPFIRVPGQLRGKSLPNLIAPVICAIHNVYNQKSDFQYVENCPIGFHNPDEAHTKQQFELIPGYSYPVNGRPQDSVYWPNVSRSMAWAYEDIKLLFEILERLTGAASYFMSNERGVSGTATRDMIINEKSETRFGLWVKRIQEDICEAVTMFLNMYKDWMPPKLAERVLGEDGESLVRNLSIDSLRGSHDIVMTPDIISGSKSYEKQAQMWAYQALSQGSIWVHPQINPKGNWNLTADTLKKVTGMSDVERYIGPEPKSQGGEIEEIKDEWTRFMQGEKFDPPEGATAMAMEHLRGHQKQKKEKYHLLDEEYRANFDEHLFKTLVNVQQFMADVIKEQAANKIALAMVGQMGPQAPSPQQVNPGPPVPQEQNMPGRPLAQGPVRNVPEVTNEPRAY